MRRDDSVTFQRAPALAESWVLKDGSLGLTPREGRALPSQVKGNVQTGAGGCWPDSGEPMRPGQALRGGALSTPKPLSLLSCSACSVGGFEQGHRGASSPQGARPLVIHETWAYARPGSVRSGHPAPLQAGKRVQSCPRPRARRGGRPGESRGVGLPSPHDPPCERPAPGPAPPSPTPRAHLCSPLLPLRWSPSQRGNARLGSGPGQVSALARHPSPPQPGSPKLGGSLGFLRWRRGRTRRTRRSFRPVHVLPEFGKKFQSSTASGK